jgi:hypothetical protein
MTNAQANERQGCQEAQEAIQLRLDEDLDAERESSLCAHLRECEPCRLHEAELQSLRKTLRSMPPLALPAEVREKVESATASRMLSFERFISRPCGRRCCAAIAATITLIVTGFWWGQDNSESTYTDAEIGQACEDLQLALKLTRRSLAQVEHLAIEETLLRKTLPAIRKTMLRWPTETTAPCQR